MNTLQIGDLSLQEKEGGLGRYFVELLRHLPMTGSSAFGLVVGKTSPEEADSTATFAQVSDSLPSRMVKVRRVAQERLAASRPDLVAAHFAPYAFPLLDYTSRLPLVVHFHGPWAAESSAERASGVATWAKAAIERLVYARARRFIVLSAFFRRELVRRYNVNPELVRVVPGGIDTSRFHTQVSRAAARRQLGWPEDRLILLAIRRQVRRMGLEELIDAMKRIVRRRPEALLMLGGTGAISGELQARVNELGLENHVRFLGRVDDLLLPLTYRAADVSVVPSRALEGFGLVTLESLASGTPVYVTSVGGLPEVIEPFAPSCIFEDASAEGMAERLEEAIAGKVRMPSEQECRDYAMANFGWKAIASRVSGVYEEAVA